MKRRSTVALLTLGLAIPLCAQRGAAHGGGSSAHSAPAFHSGGFSASNSAPRLTGAPRYTGSLPITSRAPSGVSSYRTPGRPGYGYGNNRGGNGNIRGGRWNYAWRYRNGVPYLSAVWVNPGLWGDIGDIGPYDDAYASAPADPDPSPPQEQPPAPSPYPTYPTQAAAHPPAEPAPEDAVTLIFRDGRSEQIHNYIMTRTTLYISDQHRREIPLDQLDLVATEKINRAAGIDFSVPGTR